MGGYNHYSWCNCGWCVKDRGYRYTHPVKKNEHEYSYIPKIETYESFTIPNVKCICCGLPIFFYQSPYGGKVFFEELGPPWIKHCCEPRCCEVKKENISKYIEKNNNLNRESTWERNGWIPCSVISEITIKNHIKKITIQSVLDMNKYSFFFQKDFFKFNFKNKFIIFLKKENELVYKISFYIDKEYQIYVSKNSNINYLLFLKLINNKETLPTELAKLFFDTLNMKNINTKEKEQLLDIIIKHPNSKKFNMNEVYYSIKTKGFNKIRKDIIKKYNFYNESTIDFLMSLENIPFQFKYFLIKQRKISKFLIKINKLKWINLKRDCTLQDYQYQFNLIKILPKTIKRKGISIYKSEKQSTFINKDNNL